VRLLGILKDPVPVSRKRKFNDSKPWPPPRSRAFRQLSTNQSLSAFRQFKTFPAAVAADATSM
jgi:hypothetical protein